MSKKKDWLQIGAGIGLIAFSVGNTPLIPDEPLLVPLGLGLIASGLRYL